MDFIVGILIGAVIGFGICVIAVGSRGDDWLNLIDLKRRIKEKATFLNYQKALIEDKRNTLKAAKLDKVLVSGTPKRMDTSDVVAEIEKMEKDVEYAQREYDRLIPLINELEQNYKELNERDKLIYLEYHCKGYSTVKIGIRYGISDRQVRRILKKVEKDIYMSEDVRKGIVK